MELDTNVPKELTFSKYPQPLLNAKNVILNVPYALEGLILGHNLDTGENLILLRSFKFAHFLKRVLECKLPTLTQKETELRGTMGHFDKVACQDLVDLEMMNVVHVLQLI